MWTQWINAKGGLFGHTIRHIIADDGGDPARHKALVQQMVEKEGAIAFVSQNAPLSGQASVSYLNEKRVPVIGGDGGSGNWYYQSPMFFPQMIHAHALYVGGLGTMAAVHNKKKVAIFYCGEADSCRSSAPTSKKAASAFGVDVVYTAQISLAQPDFTAECLAAKNAGADVLAPYTDSNSVPRVAKSCASVGWKPALFAVHNVQPNILKESMVDGMSVSFPVAPWFANPPATAEYHDAARRFGSGANPDDVFPVVGWAGAKLFERAAAAAKAGGTDPNTSQAILNGLWALKGDNLGGLTYPLTFQRDAPTPPRYCWFPAQVKGGKWTDRTNGGQPTCKDGNFM